MATLVRNMYSPDERKNKATRELKLRTNPNILFKIMRRGEVHVLLFNPSDAVDKWVKIIKEWVGTHDLSVQVTMKFKHEVVVVDHTEGEEKKKRSTKARQKTKKVDTTINLTGNKDNLKTFCRNFPNLWMRVLNEE